MTTKINLSLVIALAYHFLSRVAGEGWPFLFDAHQFTFCFLAATAVDDVEQNPRMERRSAPVFVKYSGMSRFHVVVYQIITSGNRKNCL
jgi:hypothetical protein